ncbi:SDR family NAD(P)-dependent oxidoreductase [Lactococcus nasutitermitis]|uniref:SDR family NAD(P)-dependent oxidoreductase n=1 Tax=Lactococcus nasutitermitis TaxID=1652957 RepID=A0ABV9JIC8_9LACT|nr:SDR family NAD(P)-dependent oxidoreductase [Lactococcus nasutitermitis]
MKTILITGGTSGVGKAISKNLAKLPETELVIVGRNEEKAKNAVREIQESTQNPNISYLLGDLSAPKQNRQIAKKFKLQHKKLDVLIHSAGNIAKTAEENIAVNLRSHYQLTQQLLPELTASGNAKILIITGLPQVIRLAPIFEQQNTTITRGIWLLTHKTLLVKLLAEELQAHKICINAFFPGDIKSDLMPYTRALTNEKLTDISQLLNSTITGQFFDATGNLITLNPQKYSPERAKKILTAYLG